MEDKGTLWLPEQASTLAPTIDWLFNFVNLVSLILFIGVIGGMLYFVYRFRRRSADERPAPIKESVWLEASWIVIPTILVLLVFTWGFRAFIEINVAPPDSYEIQAVGYQWGWRFTYPNDACQTAGEIYAPVGRPVRMVMSATDVLHSFFIPSFRVKQDVLPNRYTSVWFEATKTGTFDIFCTEYCGTQHSGMIGKIHVVNQNEFNEWLEGGCGAAEVGPEWGETLARQNGCMTCHSVDGSSGVGPTWQGLYGKTGHPTNDGAVTVDENYLRESILVPGAKVVQGYQNVMPPYSHLSEDQLASIIAYIKTL